MPTIPKADIPRFVRSCYDAWRKANIRVRQAETERLKFYVGGDLQWRPEELERRRGENRPWVTDSRIKPAVDNVEGDIRLNPPGPQCHPVGGGADPDAADIHEGLIREIEYRCQAKTAYSTAAKYSAVTGYGVLELATERVSEHSFAQQLVINSVEDPATIFFDPNSRMANRQDAMWAGKMRMYSNPDEYRAAFPGRRLLVLEPHGVQRAMGWIQEAMGVGGEAALINEWTGAGKGPFYVCEFYLVEIEPVKLRMYSDNVARFDGETVPKSVKPLEGEENVRSVGKRVVRKYVVDALEVLNETTWPGQLIPLFPVLGPEIYIDGVLHRLSLISNGIDQQRALNYVATTMIELAGAMPKSPWIGPEGTFEDERWKTASKEMWAYLEYKPVFIVDESTGQRQLAPPPQRNQWETPIQWLIQLGAYFIDSIKAVTSIYNPSLGQERGGQSGRAIQQLRSESNVANFSHADNLHRAIEIMYGEIVYINQQILDGQRVVTIVRPDSQHELTEINREFGADGIDPKTGKKGKPNNITVGRYAVRVTVDRDFDTRQREAGDVIGDFLAHNPQAAGVPGVAAKYLRIIGNGNPQIESMADLLEPAGMKDVTPEQIAQKLNQAQAQNQALSALVQKLQQAILSKTPEIEAKKWIAMVNAIAGIREAEIKARIDKAQQDLDAMEHLTGLAHDVALQAHSQVHEANMQAADQAHAAGMQASQQEAAAQAAPQEQQTPSEEAITQ